MTLMQKLAELHRKAWQEIIFTNSSEQTGKEWKSYIDLMTSLNPTQKLLPQYAESLGSRPWMSFSEYRTILNKIL